MLPSAAIKEYSMMWGRSLAAEEQEKFIALGEALNSGDYSNAVTLFNPDHESSSGRFATSKGGSSSSSSKSSDNRSEQDKIDDEYSAKLDKDPDFQRSVKAAKRTARAGAAIGLLYGISAWKPLSGESFATGVVKAAGSAAVGYGVGWVSGAIVSNAKAGTLEEYCFADDGAKKWATNLRKFLEIMVENGKSDPVEIGPTNVDMKKLGFSKSGKKGWSISQKRAGTLVKILIKAGF